MTTGTESDTWRKKYLDTLGSLETERQQFDTTAAAIKRLIGRLCTAALGQSPRLDEQLRKLQSAVRRELSAEELDKITPALTEAIHSLDTPLDQVPIPSVAPSAPTPSTKQQPASTPAVVVANDERLRAILAALLAELRRDAELTARVDALDAKLSHPLTGELLPDVLSPLAELVGQRIQRIEQAKQEIEVLLGDMVGKLDEIGQFVTDQHQSQNQSHASSETLNTQLVGEIKAIGESVEASGDLQQIRQQVRRGMETIDNHLRAFREREAALATTMGARNEQMRSRIVELEGEAKRLHTQLQVEQRLSTLDALTGISNRFAYEKRVEEELHRWQRFKQPTCLAVWDVDHFKRVNDTYGHRAGDRVLRAVAECFSSRIRNTDFVARYGGEEFVMILPGTQLEAAAHLSEQLRSAIAAIGFHFRGTPVSITVSSGLTTLHPGDSTGAAFDRADKALYRAKQEGRNRCVTA